ncbi:rsgI3 [Symbiodinium microadriaticum]|nr:rsgI3 [Symbiodinium microadriaticum]
MHNGNFPHVKQGDNFCIRCSGYLSTKNAGNYKFYTASDDGSLLYLNGEQVVDNNGCHGEHERSSHHKFLGPGVHRLVVDMCEMGGGEAFKLRYEGPDTGNSKVMIPTSALKHEVKPFFADGLDCDYFYGQAQCHVPDLSVLTPAHSTILPNIYMHNGRFPRVRQSDNFCLRCSGVLTTSKSGDYTFYTASDDGSLLYLDGAKVVDNNGCHGEQERSSHGMFLAAGTHHLVVEMCEMGGGEAFKLRYEGPDTGGSKVAVPAPVLKHEVLRASDGLECDYFYGQAQCHVPDLGGLIPSHSAILPHIDMHNGNFPHITQGDNFCIRCSGYLSTKNAGNYKFYTASDDGSLLYLNGEQVVDNNGCHGEHERSSHHRYLTQGLHHMVLDMCEMGGGESLKMRYEGPDTGNSKVTIPMSALKHQAKRPLTEGLECDYFYGQAQCDVPDLAGLTAAHTAILPNIYMHHGNFPHVKQCDNFCIRCSGYLSTRNAGNYKFYTASDDGSLLYLNGAKVVDNNGCHGESEKSSESMFLTAGTHRPGGGHV